MLFMFINNFFLENKELGKMDDVNLGKLFFKINYVFKQQFILDFQLKYILYVM